MTNNLVQSQEMVCSPQNVREQVNLIQGVMNEVMKENEHYGVIPGCGSKKVLLKAGAEKLSLTFKLSSKFRIDTNELPNNHREYIIITTITHVPTGLVYGEGVGSCSTMESKYRYRNASLKCPVCGNSTIIKGKIEYGGGYICYKAKGGCGAKFSDTDERISGQTIGKVENTDIADCYNTVLKIAKKRSLVDAILTVTAASDIFTQDLEESIDLNGKQDVNEEKTQIPSTIAQDKKTYNIIEIQKQISEEFSQMDTIDKLSSFYKATLPKVKNMGDKAFLNEFNTAVKEMKKKFEENVKTNEDIPQ